MPTVETGDIATYYEEAGAGEPLILICGLSADLQAWRFQIPELSKRFRVICYDNRGAGRTNAPDQPYSIAGMAEDLAALGVKHVFGNELLEGLAGRERRIELDQRFGPEHFAVELIVHEPAEIGIADVEEAARVLRVVRDDLVAEIEDVHRRLPPSAVGQLDKRRDRFGSDSRNH